MRFDLHLDHLVVVARSLAEGVAYVEAILGAETSPGGRHAFMGTHNRLLALGDVYLEVIAIDPEAPKPPHRRWFNLDAYDGAPRLMNWAVRTDDLDAALEAAPPGSGNPRAAARGDLSWRIAVSDFGRLPFDDAVPVLLQWDGDAHPAKRLPDNDMRLLRLDVFHPDAEALEEAFPALRKLDSIAIRKGPEKRLIATIKTADGNRVLA